MESEVLYLIIVGLLMVVMVQLMALLYALGALKGSFPPEVLPLLGEGIGLARYFAERTATPIDNRLLDFAEGVVEVVEDKLTPPASSSAPASPSIVEPIAGAGG